MRQTTNLFFGFLSVGTMLCGSSFAADPQLLNLVMPDARILAGINATSARISPLGVFIISKIGIAIGQDQQKFVAATGFNPFQDVSEVLAASNGDLANPNGLVMVRGNFPVDKIASAISSTGANGPQLSNYGGATLITITDANAKVPHAAAFFGTSIAIAGDLASVKAAIDRSAGANSLDTALAVKVNALSATQDEWLVSTAPISALIPQSATAAAKGPAAQVLPLLKSVQSFNGGVKLTNNVVFTGEAMTNDPKNAQSLNAVIRLGMTLLSSMGSSGSNAQLADVVQLLQTMQLSTDGPALDLSLSIPETQIENLLNNPPGRVKAIAAAEPQPTGAHIGN